MNIDYSIVSIMYNQIILYCIYYYPDDSDEDYFVMSNNKIITFDNIKALMSFAENKKMSIDQIGEPYIYDVNRLEFLKSNLDGNLNCNEVINYWNIADTICNTMKIKFPGKKKKYDFVYNELFGGCNTAVNLYEYHPEWNDSDLDLIKEVLEICFELFDKYII